MQKTKRHIKNQKLSSGCFSGFCLQLLCVILVFMGFYHFAGVSGFCAGAEVFAGAADGGGSVKRGSVISERSLGRLDEQFDEALDVRSTLQRRREFKNIVRSALSLIEKRPEASNRFEALGLVFRCQKQLLVMDNSRRNQEAIIETARKLMDAPGDYALERFEADVLLSQWQLDSDGATEHQRAVSVAELADRYRNTEAEVESLMVASEIAFNLGEAELLKEFRRTLSTRFTGNAKAVGFLRERFAYKSSSLMFRGRFKDADGETLVLPIDRAGHVYLSCFWSHDTPGVKERLVEIKELQKKYDGRFEVLSFNLDELEDAGKKTLRNWGMDFRAMHLPDGKNNKLFRSCTSSKDFLIRITNANGYIILTPIGSTYRTYGRLTDVDEYMFITIEEDRLLSSMQTARIGDFLVTDPFEPFDANSPAELAFDTIEPKENSVGADVLKSIQDCFVAPPMRYRLSKQQALENYQRAVKLCDEAINKYTDSDNLWVVYNRKIIALLGCWNLSGEGGYLNLAVRSADTVMGMDVPEQARVAAKFCLARAALRKEGVDAKALLSDFIKDAGGPKACASYVGAAAVLSLDAGLSEFFYKYRDILLDEHLDNRQLWSLTACFFNKFVVSKLFRGNYYGSDMRIFVGFREYQKDTEVRPRKFLIELKNLAGEAIEFPKPDADASNVVVFMEQPADKESADLQVEMVKRLDEIAKTHVHKKLNFVMGFVSEDVEAIKALVRMNNWDASKAAMVPGGISNPHVLRLGIFLADKRPNTFMVTHDGTVLWSMSGMYQMSAGTNAVPSTVKELTQRHDLTVGEAALQKGDFEKALKIFEGSFPPERRKHEYLKNAQLIGRSKAYKGMKNFKEAVAGYDNVVQDHEKHSSRGYCVCHSLCAKLLLRADILESMGKEDDAAADRLRAKRLGCPSDKAWVPDAVRYEPAICNKLEFFKVRKQWQDAFDYINDIIVNNKDGKGAKRNEYADVLRQRGEILEHLGESEKAQKDRLHAEVLAEYGKSGEVESQPEDQHKLLRYVDVVRESGTE